MNGAHTAHKFTYTHNMCESVFSQETDLGCFRMAVVSLVVATVLELYLCCAPTRWNKVRANDDGWLGTGGGRTTAMTMTQEQIRMLGLLDFHGVLEQ